MAEVIDPKFNEIPADERPASEREQWEKQHVPARGLSINETIARDANLSVGGKGVNTSGVAAGAGAGAGSTFLTPGNEGSSPAPRFVPGNRGIGTTPLSDAPSSETSSDRTSFDK